MKKVLITGATGFLGKNVVRLLLQKDVALTALVRKSATLDAQVREVIADLTNADSVRKIRTSIEGTGLIHLAAAMPAAGSSSEEQERIQKQQTEGLKHLLSVLPESIKHIVYASSIDVFGIPKTLPIDETHPTDPVTAYGRAKLEGERLLREYCKKNGCTLTILRITQIYGPHEPVIKAIPLFIKKIMANEAPVIFGDGGDLRDYIEVSDAARAVVMAAEQEKNGTYVIATGESVALRSVAETIIGLSGAALRPQYRERQKPRIDFRFDVSKAEHDLGFRAHTPLSKGLQMQYDATLHTQ